MRILYFLPLMLAGGFNFAAPVFAQSAASNDDLRNEIAELKSEVGKLESENSRLPAPGGRDRGGESAVLSELQVAF
jgi:cell division protein FtsB